MYSWLIRQLAMPAVCRLTHSRFWDLYRRMLKLEQSPREQLRALQWSKFKRLLDHAHERVPMHRQRMEAQGLTPGDIDQFDDLAKIPITTKKEIQRHFPDRVTDEQSDRTEWQYVSTRGTADRLMAIHDFAKRDTVRATAVRAMHLSGDYRLGKKMVEIPPNICNIVCGDEGEELEGVLPYAWQMTRSRQWGDRKAIGSLRGLIERGWIYRKRTYPPFGTAGSTLPEEQLADYAHRLRRDRPYALKALPTYLFELAQYVQATGQPPLPVQVAKPMGSSASPHMQKIIEAGFEGSYREDYGSAEFGDMACDCQQRDGLHVFMDQFLIEVVRQGRAAGDGELGTILVTDLGNFAMPFIRYRIGDVGRLIHEQCPCGRTAPKLVVEGRLEDTIVTSKGKVITNDRFMDFFYQRPEISEFQLVEKQVGRMDLIVVSRNGNPPSEALAQDLRAFLDDDVQVDVYPAKTIQPENSGKFRFVKSCTYDRIE